MSEKKVNLNYMYGVLCESDSGLDAFGNPIGKPILFESVGEGMNKFNAIQKVKELSCSGKYGRVKVVRLEVCDCIF
jgi:hypothetical protein